MSTENELTCPVCRAKQACQAACRRCGADLSLWIKALRSLHEAKRQVANAAQLDTANHDSALNYLRWLSPKAAQTAKASE